MPQLLSSDEIITTLIDRVIANVQEVLGPDYRVEEREPLDTEILPFQCWIATATMVPSPGYADAGQMIQLSSRIFVTTVYEISRTTQHYRETRILRKSLLKALHRSVILPIGDALITIGDEETFLEESFFLSAFPILISWSEGVLE